MVFRGPLHLNLQAGFRRAWVLDLGYMLILHQSFIVNIAKSQTAPCDHGGIRRSSLTCAFASETGRAAAGSSLFAIFGAAEVRVDRRASFQCRIAGKYYLQARDRATA